MYIVRLIGLLLIAVGFATLVYQWMSISGQAIAPGRVIELVPSRTSKGRGTFRIKAAYQDPSGANHEYLSTWAANPPGYAVGDPVRIVFPLDQPQQGRLLSFGARFAIGWIIFGIGVLVLWIACGFIYGNDFLQTLFPSPD